MMEIPQEVQALLQTLETAGYEAWCVGGCVRDALLGRLPEDWDVTTNARPQALMALFDGQAIPTGLRHGTVTVRTGGRTVEVTTYRCDGRYADHRHPDQVTFSGSLQEDLRRRDFTVNAMALSLRGEIQDPFHGRSDLQKRTLRCVGEADQRLEEDALRILRALRFSAVLGFSIEARTARSLHEKRKLLSLIAVERIWAEFQKLLCGTWAAEVLREYVDVVGVFLPEVLPAVGLDQRNRHHCFDVWEHTLRAVEATPPEMVLRMTMLLHDLGKPRCFTLDEAGHGHFFGHPAVSAELARRVLSRLRVDSRSRDTILTLVAWHDRVIPRTERGVRRALRDLGEERLRLLFCVKRADNLAQAPAYRATQGEINRAEAILDELLAKDDCFSLKQLAVSGRDLMALGFQGREIGAALEALLTGVVDGRLPNEREALLRAAMKERSSS